MSRILVTGANGFIGIRLCQVLVDGGYEVRAALRRDYPHDDLAAQEQAVVGDIGPGTRWEEALQGVDRVIHLAARVHVMKEVVADPLADFREVNLKGAVRLAEEAAELGVKRFVYVSSIKVNGEETNGHPITADAPPNPLDPYAISKAEAEAKLREIGARMKMEVVIVRPPLVYGAGVRGNFLRLMKLVERGLPLPLSQLHNSRSMVSLNNMSDLLVRCVEHPGAADEIFLVSDGVDWSTPELIRSIACHLGVPVRLFPVPLSLLKLAGSMTGQSGRVNRLCDSLEVDIDKTRDLLGWTPPQSPDEGVREAVEWYLGNRDD